MVQLIIKKKEIWTISTFILTTLLDLTADLDTVDDTILLLSRTIHRDQRHYSKMVSVLPDRLQFSVHVSEYCSSSAPFS